jgi:hypothetical protein
VVGSQFTVKCGVVSSSKSPCVPLRVKASILACQQARRAPFVETKVPLSQRLPLGCEYVAAAIVGQRADGRHQPASTRNGELVGNRAIEDLPSRFNGHLRIGRRPPHFRTAPPERNFTKRSGSGAARRSKVPRNFGSLWNQKTPPALK